MGKPTGSIDRSIQKRYEASSLPPLIAFSPKTGKIKNAKPPQWQSRERIDNYAQATGSIELVEMLRLDDRLPCRKQPRQVLLPV